VGYSGRSLGAMERGLSSGSGILLFPFHDFLRPDVDLLAPASFWIQLKLGRCIARGFDQGGVSLLILAVWL